MSREDQVEHELIEVMGEEERGKTNKKSLGERMVEEKEQEETKEEGRGDRW